MEQVGLIVLAAVMTVIFALGGWIGKRLVERNDTAHERLWDEVKDLRVEIGDLKVGQAEIKAQLGILIKNGGGDG